MVSHAGDTLALKADQACIDVREHRQKMSVSKDTICVPSRVSGHRTHMRTHVSITLTTLISPIHLTTLLNLTLITLVYQESRARSRERTHL